MHVIVIGGTRSQREAAATAQIEGFVRKCLDAVPNAPSPEILTISAETLPFRFPPPAHDIRAAVRVTRFVDLHLAFPDCQTEGTRLVLTQPLYLLQKWAELFRPPSHIVATARRAELETAAPEAFQRRGPWQMFTIKDLGPDVDEPFGPKDVSDQNFVERLLIQAFRARSAAERLKICRRAAEAEPKSPHAALALASACFESQERDGARAALDRAVALASWWEAAHFEYGKFWLAAEDMERACAAFGRACRMMPTFSASWSNLGATLGELDRPEEALNAFEQALKIDSDCVTTLNNIGVVTRELGRLDDSEAALLDVIRIKPDFVFGYYNLGHTLLLAKRYSDALAAYEHGWKRDPQKNRRQGCRMALARLANGDVEGARRQLFQEASSAPAAEREDLLLEAYEVARALIAAEPRLAVHRTFLDEIAGQLRD